MKTVVCVASRHEITSSKDDKCIVNKLDLNKDQRVFPVGSFRFDYDNRKKSKLFNKYLPNLNTTKKAELFELIKYFNKYQYIN